jgi:hypothetical protein
MNLDWVSKPFWQVPPCNPGPVAIDHSFDEPPVVLSFSPNIPGAAWQAILNPIPLIIPKGITARLSAPNQLTAIEPRNPILGNPLIEDKL